MLAVFCDLSLAREARVFLNFSYLVIHFGLHLLFLFFWDRGRGNSILRITYLKQRVLTFLTTYKRRLLLNQLTVHLINLLFFLFNQTYPLFCTCIILFNYLALLCQILNIWTTFLFQRRIHDAKLVFQCSNFSLFLLI